MTAEDRLRAGHRGDRKATRGRNASHPCPNDTNIASMALSATGGVAGHWQLAAVRGTRGGPEVACNPVGSGELLNLSERITNKGKRPNTISDSRESLMIFYTITSI